MKKRLSKRLFQVGLFALIAAVLIYWQYAAMSSTELEEVKTSFKNTQWHYLGLAMIFGFLSHFFRALRWQLLLKPIGYATRTGVITGAVLMGYLANALIPRAGEVIRCSTLYRYDRVPVDKSLGTVISERLFDMLCLGGLFVVALSLEYNYVSAYALELYDTISLRLTPDIRWSWAWGLLLIVTLTALYLIIRIIYRRLLSSRAGGLFKSLLLGVRSIFLLKKRGLFILYSLCIWLLYILMVYTALKAVPHTEHLTFSVAMVLTAFGSIAVILTPGGIGAYPPVIAGLLSIYAIPYSYGLSAGWVSWTMQTVVVLFLGVVTLVYLPFTKNKNQHYG